MMDEKYKGIPTSEPFPELLEKFMMNKPNMKYENVYLCESIDMDGNVVDTKIGVNLMTNYGLSDRFVSGNDRDKNIWLGSGSTEPDPASSQLTSYISNLGKGSGLVNYDTYYPHTYDRTTKIWTSRRKVCQEYWDYTAGNNAEYEIWEIGVGSTQTTLLTHALIYDKDGNQTCIVKRPNTRLYITVFWTNTVSMATIPQLYNEGKYVLIDPVFQHADSSSRTLYWNFLARGRQYGYDNNGSVYYWSNNNISSTWSAVSTNDKCVAVTGDPREISYNKGPALTKTFQKPYWYVSGLCISDVSWINESQNSSFSGGAFSCLSFEQIPEPEEMETEWALPNKHPLANGIITKNGSYSGNELNDNNLYRLDWLFGYGHNYFIDNPKTSNQASWDYPRGMLPCTDFDVTELRMYNYLTKEYDIDVPFKNNPDSIYCYPWIYLYMRLWVKYKDDNGRYVYVYANMYPHDENGVPKVRIIKFNNSNMVLAATDEYWDPSTYVEIPNLSSVPEELQQKRYYVVVSGTNAALDPTPSPDDEYYIRLDPVNKPWELTHAETGVLPKLPNSSAYSEYDYNTGSTGYSYERYRRYGQPLISNDKGYFVIDYMLVFLDKDKNCTRYNLLLDDKYNMDQSRRWVTEHGDKILMFPPRNSDEVVDDVYKSLHTITYAQAANRFSVWTVVDKDTPPTREDFELVWSDSSVVNNNKCYHRYSWSNKGYLVCAKRRVENEFIYVNVFEEGVPQHLVTNAKFCNVIENTNMCCYQDTNLSQGNTYVFQVYNMDAETIVGTFTIEDGSTYTVEGIYGYNTHVYIRVKDTSNVTYTYYYNTENGSLERVSSYFYMCHAEAPYWTYRNIIFEDTCITFPMVSSTTEIVVISGNEWHNLFADTTKTSTCNGYGVYPTINVMNDGKQVILCRSSANPNSYGTNIIIDLGELLDSETKKIEHYPYSYFECSAYNSTGSSSYTDSLLIPFNDGIIIVGCGANSWSATNQVGRMWWFPLDMCLKLHMKGTTRTLNSYNAPVNFTLTKSLQYKLTNDLSRLLPNNGG